MARSTPLSSRRAPMQRRNPITKAYALYSEEGLVFRGAPAPAIEIAKDLMDEWEAEYKAAGGGKKPTWRFHGASGEQKQPKLPQRPKLILVAEMSDGSWLEAEPTTGKLKARNETIAGRASLERRIAGIQGPKVPGGRGRWAIQGALAPLHEKGSSVRLETPQLMEMWKTEQAQPVVLSAQVLKAERATYADRLGHGIEARGGAFFVEGAPDRPHRSRAAAAFWRDTILHKGQVRQATDGKSWIIEGAPRPTVQERLQVEKMVEYTGKDKKKHLRKQLVWETRDRLGPHTLYGSYEDAWQAYRAQMRAAGKVEKVAREARLAQAQAYAKQQRTGHPGVRAVSAKAAAELAAAGESLHPRQMGVRLMYRGVPIFYTEDGWHDIPALKRGTYDRAQAQRWIDIARENQAKRLGKTVANPRGQTRAKARRGKPARRARSARRNPDDVGYYFKIEDHRDGHVRYVDFAGGQGAAYQHFRYLTTDYLSYPPSNGYTVTLFMRRGPVPRTDDVALATSPADAKWPPITLGRTRAPYGRANPREEEWDVYFLDDRKYPWRVRASSAAGAVRRAKAEILEQVPHTAPAPGVKSYAHRVGCACRSINRACSGMGGLGT